MKSDKFNKHIRNILQKRRDGRMKKMMSLVNTWPNMRILDVGCGIDGRSFSDKCDPTWEIVGVDLHDPGKINHKNPKFSYQVADVRDLSMFEDGEFDLLISVGMLEHIVPPADYAAACSEMQRVSKQYVIVVPDRWGWLEPHYGFPFFGALPKSVQRSLIRIFNLSGHRNQLDFFESDFIWRTRKQYRTDFVGSEINVMPTLETIAITKRAAS